VPSLSPICRVRIVVVNFNGGEFLGRTIEALLATVTACAVEIVVVDNASTDGLLNGVMNRFPTVRLIRSSSNLGFAGGNNLALRDLTGIDAVALVNSDCFVSPGWLDPLIAALDADDRVGTASPKILFDGRWRPVTVKTPTFMPGHGDGRTLGVRVHDGPTPIMFGKGFSHHEQGFRWTDDNEAELFVADQEPTMLRLAAERTKPITINGHPAEVGEEPTDLTVSTDETVNVINNAGNELTDTWWGRERGFAEADRGQWDQPGDIPGWCGACVLLRTGYLHDVGLLDDRFFLYFEDTDLSLRGAKQGWRYRYEPASVVRHGHGLSSGSTSQLSRFCTERNRLVVIARHASKATAVRLWAKAAADATKATAARDVVEAKLRWRSLAGAMRILASGKPGPAASAN
jgi:GT2 family glycosyltransferase